MVHVLYSIRRENYIKPRETYIVLWKRSRGPKEDMEGDEGEEENSTQTARPRRGSGEGQAGGRPLRAGRRTKAMKKSSVMKLVPESVPHQTPRRRIFSLY